MAREKSGGEAPHDLAPIDSATLEALGEGAPDTEGAFSDLWWSGRRAGGLTCYVQECCSLGKVSDYRSPEALYLALSAAAVGGWNFFESVGRVFEATPLEPRRPAPPHAAPCCPTPPPAAGESGTGAARPACRRHITHITRTLFSVTNYKGRNYFTADSERDKNETVFHVSGI